MMLNEQTGMASYSHREIAGMDDPMFWGQDDTKGRLTEWWSPKHATTHSINTTCVAEIVLTTGKSIFLDPLVEIPECTIPTPLVLLTDRCPALFPDCPDTNVTMVVPIDSDEWDPAVNGSCPLYCLDPSRFNNSYTHFQQIFSSPMELLTPSYLHDYPSIFDYWYGSASNAFRYAPSLEPLGGFCAIAGCEPYLAALALFSPSFHPNHTTMWAPPYYNVVYGFTMISVVQPIYVGDDYRGSIGADVNLAELGAYLEGASSTPTSVIMLVNKRGEIMAATQRSYDLIFCPSLCGGGASGFDISTHSPTSGLVSLRNSTTMYAAVIDSLEEDEAVDVELGGETHTVFSQVIEHLNLEWYLVLAVPKRELEGAAVWTATSDNFIIKEEAHIDISMKEVLKREPQVEYIELSNHGWMNVSWEAVVETFPHGGWVEVYPSRGFLKGNETVVVAVSFDFANYTLTFDEHHNDHNYDIGRSTVAVRFSQRDEAVAPCFPHHTVSYSVEHARMYAAWKPLAVIQPLAYTLYTICVGFLAIVIVVFTKFRRTKLIRSTSLGMHLMTVFGALVLSTSSLLFAHLPDKEGALCVGRLWLTWSGVLLTFLPIFLKLYRLNQIFFAAKLRLNRKLLKSSHLWRRGFGLMVFPLIVTIWYQITNPPTREVSVLEKESMLVEDCSRSTVHVTALNVYVLFVVAWGTYMTYRGRKLPSAFNETTHIVIAVTVLIMFYSVIVPMQFLAAGDPDSLMVTRSIAPLSGVILAMMGLFVPKIVMLLLGEGNIRSSLDKTMFGLTQMKSKKKLDSDDDEDNQTFEDKDDGGSISEGEAFGRGYRVRRIRGSTSSSAHSSMSVATSAFYRGSTTPDADMIATDVSLVHRNVSVPNTNKEPTASSPRTKSSRASGSLNSTNRPQPRMFRWRPSGTAYPISIAIDSDSSSQSPRGSQAASTLPGGVSPPSSPKGTLMASPSGLQRPFPLDRPKSFERVKSIERVKPFERPKSMEWRRGMEDPRVYPLLGEATDSDTLQPDSP